MIMCFVNNRFHKSEKSSKTAKIMGAGRVERK